MKRAREQLRRAHLQRFDAELAGLDAYADMWALLEVGVAYHHSGMLPVLREFVELCFQQRLVQVREGRVIAGPRFRASSLSGMRR